ncbi:MAG: YeeE/YedE thiosulfate transporter family protein [Caldilineaceae bacterium]
MNPYVGGILLGVVLFLAFFITGSGLGAQGGLNRAPVFFEDMVAGARGPHVVPHQHGGRRHESAGNWIVFLTLGTVIGGFVSGWANGRLRVETGKGPSPTARAGAWPFSAASSWLWRTLRPRLHIGAGVVGRRRCCRWAVGPSCSPSLRAAMPGLLLPPVLELTIRQPSENQSWLHLIGSSIRQARRLHGLSAHRRGLRRGAGDVRLRQSPKLARQFYFKEMTVLKVMFMGIVVAMLLIFWATAMGWLNYNLIWVNPTYLWPGIVGGLIMGVGFIIGGFCPGTSLVAAATLKLDGIFFARAR